MLGVVFTVYAGAHQLGLTAPDIRTLAFATLITSNLMLIVTNRQPGRFALSRVQIGRAHV